MVSLREFWLQTATCTKNVLRQTVLDHDKNFFVIYITAIKLLLNCTIKQNYTQNFFKS